MSCLWKTEPGYLKEFAFYANDVVNHQTSWLASVANIIKQNHKYFKMSTKTYKDYELFCGTFFYTIKP